MSPNFGDEFVRRPCAGGAIVTDHSMPVLLWREGEGANISCGYGGSEAGSWSGIDWASLFFVAPGSREFCLPVKVNFERVVHAGFDVD